MSTTTHQGTKVTNVSTETTIYITFNSIDEVEPPQPPNAEGSLRASTPLLPGKTLVYDPQDFLESDTPQPRVSVVKMYVWKVQPVTTKATLVWQGYVATSITTPLKVDPDRREVRYNETLIPNIDLHTGLIEKFQHYADGGTSTGTCLSGGSAWFWILAVGFVLIVVMAVVLSRSSSA